MSCIEYCLCIAFCRFHRISPECHLRGTATGMSILSYPTAWRKCSRAARIHQTARAYLLKPPLLWSSQPNNAYQRCLESHTGSCTASMFSSFSLALSRPGSPQPPCPTITVITLEKHKVDMTLVDPNPENPIIAAMFSSTSSKPSI